MDDDAILVENRKCKLCGVLKDKYDFVLECSLYAENRKVNISKYFWNRPNMYKFIELLCIDSKNTIRIFKYVY